MEAAHPWSAGSRRRGSCARTHDTPPLLGPAATGPERRVRAMTRSVTAHAEGQGGRRRVGRAQETAVRQLLPMGGREKDVVYVPRVDASGAVALQEDDKQEAPAKERKAKRPRPVAEEDADAGGAEADAGGVEGDAEAEPLSAGKKKGSRRKARKAVPDGNTPLSKQQANQLRAWKKQGKQLTAAQEARLVQAQPANARMKQWRSEQPAATHRRFR